MLYTKYQTNIIIDPTTKFIALCTCTQHIHITNTFYEIHKYVPTFYIANCNVLVLCSKYIYVMNIVFVYIRSCVYRLFVVFFFPIEFVKMGWKRSFNIFITIYYADTYLVFNNIYM